MSMRNKILLTCSGVLVTVIAIAAYAILKSRLELRKKSCINNLLQMDGASVSWALEHSKKLGDDVDPAGIFGTDKYIRVPPKCPSGGTYTLGPLGVGPKCSFPEHTLPSGPWAAEVPALRREAEGGNTKK
jgi:hypothetical protein